MLYLPSKYFVTGIETVEVTICGFKQLSVEGGIIHDSGEYRDA